MHDGYYHKTSFPIVLTYVMMGHKSQGATIATTVIIDIKKLSHMASHMSCFLESQIETMSK
jgi:hypothetical protein